MVSLSMTLRALGLKGLSGRQNNLMNGPLCEIANALIPLGLEATQEEGLSLLDFALCAVQTSMSMENKKEWKIKKGIFLLQEENSSPF